jgi:hypothetical protein
MNFEIPFDSFLILAFQASSLAQAAPAGIGDWLATLPWFAWVAIVGIICGTLSGCLGAHYRHRERIEMIRQGMDPDGGKAKTPEL